MVNNAARKNDLCTGHLPCFPPRAAIQGSPDVFYNGLPAHRRTDRWMFHMCGKGVHDGFLLNGSPTVFNNGLQQGRVGDPVNCGSTVMTGSPDIFIGDQGGGDGNTTPQVTRPTTPELPSGPSAPDGTPIGRDGSRGGTVPYYGSPGGGGRPSSGGYVSAGSQHAITPGTPPPASPSVSDQRLGGLSARYESGNRGAGAIGNDSTGGYSYGSYQIATNTGTMNNYMNYLAKNNPEYYSQLQSAGGVDGARAGSAQFQSTWQNLANDPKFAATQHDFIQATHYDVTASRLQSQGLDLSTRSASVRDAVWSASVHNGPRSSLFTNAFEGRDPSKMTDAQVINALYDERSAANPDGSLKYFSSSTQRTQNSLRDRFTSERRAALAGL